MGDRKINFSWICQCCTLKRHEKQKKLCPKSTDLALSSEKGIGLLSKKRLILQSSVFRCRIVS